MNTSCIYKQKLGPEIVEQFPCPLWLPTWEREQFLPRTKEPFPKWPKITSRDLCKSRGSKKGAGSLMAGEYPRLSFHKGLGLPWGLWLRLCLLTKETWVWSLVGEDPTGRGAIRSTHHNYWIWTPRAWALPQEKPLQWEDCALQLESSSCLIQLEESPCSSEDPAQPK